MSVRQMRLVERSTFAGKMQKTMFSATDETLARNSCITIQRPVVMHHTKSLASSFSESSFRNDMSGVLKRCSLGLPHSESDGFVSHTGLTAFSPLWLESRTS